MPVDCRYHEDTDIEDDTEPSEGEITLCIPCFGTLYILAPLYCYVYLDHIHVVGRTTYVAFSIAVQL